MSYLASRSRLTRRAATIVLALCLLQSGGCTSYRPVPLESDTLHQELRLGNLVRPGDRIRVATQSGESVTLVVDQVGEEHLTAVGGPVISYTDIVSIESRDYDPVKTTVAVIGGSTILTVILISAALSSVVFLP
jgi:hypothetical protein